jgi:hypothetical protein
VRVASAEIVTLAGEEGQRPWAAADEAKRAQESPLGAALEAAALEAAAAAIQAAAEASVAPDSSL